MLARFPEMRLSAAEALNDPLFTPQASAHNLSRTQPMHSIYGSPAREVSDNETKDSVSRKQRTASIHTRQIDYSQYVTDERDGKRRISTISSFDVKPALDSMKSDIKSSDDQRMSSDILRSSIAIMNDTKKKSFFFKALSINVRV